MKTVLRSYVSNFKNILFLLIIINLIFLILFNTYIYPAVLNFTLAKKDIIDVNYYKEIFNNLNFSVIIVVVLLTSVFVFYEKIKNYLINVLSKKNLLSFCITTNIIIQVFLIVFLTTQPISDSKHHIDNALRLYETGSYINEYGNLTAFWTVGLPAYLAFLKSLIPDFILTAKILNIIISTGLILICYFVFKNFLKPAALNVFLIIFTFFPNNLFSSNIILTDYPFTFLLWISVLLLIMMHKNSSVVLPVLIGISLALSSFLRPAGIILPFVFAGILLFKKCPSGIKNSFIMLTIFFAHIVPMGT